MTFVEALDSALAQQASDEIRRRTHALVADELATLAPGLELHSTEYFNHSFVPDLVVRWSNGGGLQERDVFFRLTVSDDAFSEDLNLLADTSSIFLGLLDGRETAAVHQLPSSSQALGNGTLITQAPSIERLRSAATGERRTADATRELVHTGRGFLDPPAATGFASSFAHALSAIDDLATGDVRASGGVAEGLDSVQPWLGELGFIAVEQALFSYWIRAGGDPILFPAREAWEPMAASPAALRRVILALLGSKRLTPAETWVRNVAHLSADELARLLNTPLRGDTLDAMATALLPYWTARWAWVEQRPSVPLDLDLAWIIDGGVLGLDLGDIAVYFADDGRRFKDKAGGRPLPELQQSSRLLAQEGVVGVHLRTALDDVDYRLRQSGRHSVYDRVGEILAATDQPNYYLRDLTVQVPGSETMAHIDFDRGHIELGGIPTPIATVARIAARFFSRIADDLLDPLDRFLASTGTGEPRA